VRTPAKRCGHSALPREESPGAQAFLASPPPADPIGPVVAASIGLPAAAPATPYLSLWARSPLRDRRPRRWTVREAFAGQAPGDAADTVAAQPPSTWRWFSRRPATGSRTTSAGG
jgi:hypothetical protein